jgi:mannosyl-oligosaccharide glucosidase
LVYGWEKHDGEHFGRQTIKDEKNNLEMVTEFVKIESGNQGGDWIVRIRGKPIDPAESNAISLIYYLGFDHSSYKTYKPDQTKSSVHLRGSTKELGEFSFFARGKSK